jgi:glycosyltransferase involved in cell wall biosynthesis
MRVLVITSIDFSSRMHQRTHDLVSYLSKFHEVVVIHNPCLIRNIRKPVASMLIRNMLSFLLRPLQLSIFHNKNGKAILLVGTRQPFSTESEMLERSSPLFRLLLYVAQPFFHMFLIFSPAFSFFASLYPSKYDVCIAEGPWGGAVSTLLRKAHVVQKVVYEDLDFFPAYAGINSKTKLGYYLTHWIERNAIRRADLVISVGHLLADLRKSQGAKEVHVLSNGYSNEFSQLSPNLTSTTVAYAGALTDWSGVLDLIKAIELASESIPDIRLLIMGDGPKKAYLEKVISCDGIGKRVEFVGKLEYEMVGDVLAKASVGAAIFVPSQLTKYAVMCKLMDYLGVGLPVLAIDFGENGALVKQNEAGICVKCDPESIANGLVKLLQDPKLLAAYSAKAKEAARGKDWDSILKDETELIEKCKG